MHGAWVSGGFRRRLGGRGGPSGRERIDDFQVGEPASHEASVPRDECAVIQSEAKNLKSHKQ